MEPTDRKPSLLARALREITHPADFRKLEGAVEGPGWVSFADWIGDEAAIDAWVARATDRYKGRRELTGSLMALTLAGPAIDLVVSLYLVKGWAAPLPADGLMLKRNEQGNTVGVALRAATVVAPEGDATAVGDEVVRVADAAAVRRYVGEQLSDLLTPAFELISARTPYKIRGSWGATVDQIAGVCARRARALGLDQQAAWETGTALIDALQEAQRMVRMRPYPFVAPWPGHGGQATVAVKGTCCLFFKTHDYKEEGAYCSNCPLLSDESRAPRMEKILARGFERFQSPPP